jgi:hypothetical protein
MQEITSVSFAYSEKKMSMRQRVLLITAFVSMILLGAILAHSQPAHPINPHTGIKWPPNCTGGLTTYNIITNQCQANGTAANPAGSTGQGQYNLGGSFAGYNFGLKWAQLLTTGGGNNGILNGIAAGATGFADPSYGSTEQYSFLSMIPNVPDTYHLKDYRQGAQVDFFHNWITGAFGSPDNAAAYKPCLSDGHPTSNPGFSSLRTCDGLWYIDSQPGWSLGNSPWGAQGWKVAKGRASTDVQYGSGIDEVHSNLLQKYGVGDSVTSYDYVNGEGGWTGYSDEGTKAHGSNASEDNFTLSGTCQTGCTTGSTAIKITNTYLSTINPKCTSILGGNCAFGTGRYLIDTTQGPTTTTTVANLANGIGGSLTALTITGTVPVSNAWGTLVGNCGPATIGAIVTNPPFTASFTCSVAVTSGTFDATHVLCFASTFHECSIPTAVGAPSGGFQSITIPLRKPHALGGYVLQGGVAGAGLEFTANNVVGLGGQTLRYLFDVVGSTSANVLQVLKWKQGTPDQITNANSIGNLTMVNTWNITSLSNSGTTVSGTYSGGAFTSPYIYTLMSWAISGASDSVFNTTCTNTNWTDSSHFTCTIAGLAGVHTAATATAGLGVNSIKIWPMAEVTDVQNEATTPPSVDGTMALEPNTIAFQTNDAIEETHHSASEFQAETAFLYVYNPYNVGSAKVFSVSGQGAQGGTGGVTSNAILTLHNLNPDTFYQGAGGWWNAPNLMNVTGSYFNGFLFDHGPANSSTGVVGGIPSTVQANDPNYVLNVFRFTGGRSNSFFAFGWSPYTGNTQYAITGQALWQAPGGHVFSGAVALPASSTINGKGLAGTGAGIPTGPTVSSTDHIATFADNSGTMKDSGITIAPNFAALSGSIGGGALTAGTCASTVVGVTGATSSMSVSVTPGTYPGDAFYWRGYVSSSNNVTVSVCAAVAGTPTASTYNVRVIQ